MLGVLSVAHMKGTDYYGSTLIIDQISFLPLFKYFTLRQISALESALQGHLICHMLVLTLTGHT